MKSTNPLGILESLSIKNFQSHADSELEFVPGVNVIIGPSDAGKSAVFRSLNWAITNRPLGDAFRSTWGGKTEVHVKTQDGDVVKRIKDKNENQYSYNVPSNAEEEDVILKAFGSDPPEEINQVFRLDEVNIQSQTDPPFLLDNTSGEVAQQLNKAASIDDIDKTLTGLKRGHKNTNSEIQRSEKDLQEQQEELKQYQDLETLEEKVQELENINNQSTQVQRQISQLTKLCKRIQDIEETLQESKGINKASEVLQEAEEQKEKINVVSQKAKNLLSIISRYEKNQEMKKELKDEITALELEYHEIEPESCPLCGHAMESEE